jgi:hypothetical protein
MMSLRRVEPELLDTLPASDPKAIRSRRNLRVINAWMGNARHFLQAIRSLEHPPRKILDLGTGDGTLMLKLRSHLTHPVELWLLDMEPVIADDTLDKFRACGWTAHIVRQRLDDWLKPSSPTQFDLTIANLFLHHFKDDELRQLLTGVAKRTDAFLSCDPRRWTPALWSTRALWLLGCNDVTRHDARISVRAGFRDREISALWPGDRAFSLREYPAGFASHIFRAVRLDKP